MSTYQDELKKKKLTLPAAYSAPYTPVSGAGSSGSNLEQVQQQGPVYQQSEALQQAAQTLANYQANRPGAYQSNYQGQIDDLLQSILSAPEFAYDVNTDPLYAQYKDQYTRAGQRAMQDTMGSGAALTGGYGSSYATAAGQQAYGDYMTGLTQRIPELYNAALNKYQMQQANQYNQLGALQGAEQYAYGQYRDEVGDWRADLDFAYRTHSDMSDREYQMYRDNLELWLQDRDYWTASAERERARTAAAAAAKRRGSSGKTSGKTSGAGGITADQLGLLAGLSSRKIPESIKDIVRDWNPNTSIY